MTGNRVAAGTAAFASVLNIHWEALSLHDVHRHQKLARSAATRSPSATQKAAGQDEGGAARCRAGSLRQTGGAVPGDRLP